MASPVAFHQGKDSPLWFTFGSRQTGDLHDRRKECLAFTNENEYSWEELEDNGGRGAKQ
jgi:hypothetical protein